MSIHMSYDHQCPTCQTNYIPYAVSIPCPTCGTIEKERFDFIPRAVESCRFNLMEGGSYEPACWFTCGFADEVLYYIFGILEEYRTIPKKKLFIVWADEVLTKKNVGYLRDQVFDMTVRIYNELENKEDKNDPTLKPLY